MTTKKLRLLNIKKKIILSNLSAFPLSNSHNVAIRRALKKHYHSCSGLDMAITAVNNLYFRMKWWGELRGLQ